MIISFIEYLNPSKRRLLEIAELMKFFSVIQLGKGAGCHLAIGVVGIGHQRAHLCRQQAKRISIAKHSFI